MGLTYKDSGVDVEAGDAFVDALGPIAKSTHRAEVVGNLGGFAGLFNLPEGYDDPVLVAGTDGVGTKLKVAFQADQHDSVGIDLVAMCVNDLICCGAEPLFFLDYFATGKLSKDKDCSREGDCRRMQSLGLHCWEERLQNSPDFTSEEYDLAGFAVGVVERGKILSGDQIEGGSVLLGLPSSGLHSNGYSLARKALLDGGGGDEWISELLKPTTIYVQAVRRALKEGGIQGIAHITGGGIAGNLVRVLPDQVRAVVDLSLVHRPPIFDAIQQAGGVSEEEMQRTFNLGVGMILVVQAEAAENLLSVLQEAGMEAVRVGYTEGGPARLW